MNLEKEQLNDHLSLTQNFQNMEEKTKFQLGNAVATIAPKHKGVNATTMVSKKKKTTTTK